MTSAEPPPGSPPDPLLVQYLSDRDEACPGCGYNLRGLRSAACPECAQELTLRVNLRDARLAGFLAGLVGLVAGAGFSGLLLVYIVVVLGISTSPPPR